MRRVPFFDLRDWWFSDDRLSEIFKVEELGYIPFFPIQEQPEASAPYAVYHFERMTGDEDWWYQTDFIMIEIRVFDVMDAYESMNIMMDMANHGAISARDLSKWIVEEDRAQDFEFHSIQFYRGGKVEPPKEQGGEFKVEMTFSIDFSPLNGRYIDI